MKTINKTNRIEILLFFSFFTTFCFANNVMNEKNEKQSQIAENTIIEQNDGSLALVHYNIDTMIIDSNRVELLEHELDSVECQMKKIKNETEQTKSENEMNSLEKQIISTIIALFILVSIWNRKRKNKNHG
jgi:hypothetical protein